MIDLGSNKALISEANAIAQEVYKDLVKPVVSEIGSTAGRTVKALLAPIRGLLWGWEQIEEVVENGVKEKFEKIPNERRKSPEPEIAVPLIQALSYTAQSETLRAMFINLLANSMDIEKEKVVHPSFVGIIKQMNSLDAKVFYKLSSKEGYQKILRPSISLKGQAKFIVGAAPEWYIGWCIDGYNEFDVSASLIRLSKFGLIELMLDRTAGEQGYAELMNNPFLIRILEDNKITYPTLELEIDGIQSLVYVNEYGLQFKNACL